MKTKPQIFLYKVAGLISQLSSINPRRKDEIAIIGRSNVGKSSLINHLFQQKDLARVSSKPGKTQTINFFDVDNHYYLVDLPGYGYAKTSKENRSEWEKLISHYFQSDRNIKCCLILLDSRHKELTSTDSILFDWLLSTSIPFIVVATKTDKLPKTKVFAQVKKLATTLKKHIKDINDIIPYSIKEKNCRGQLLSRLNEFYANE